MLLARQFDAKFRAGEIQILDDDVDDGGSKRIMEHTGRAPMIQGQHLRGPLNQPPRSPKRTMATYAVSSIGDGKHGRGGG